MDIQNFDVIIIGAGIAGSSSAYQFSKLNKKVLLLEQFSLNNDFNSSHGGSRIFRFAHEEAVLMPMARNALKSWRQLENETNMELLRLCGFLWIGSHELTKKRSETMKNNNAEFELLNNNDINSRFKHLKLNENYSGLYDSNGGVLLADKCIEATQKMAKKNGAVLRENEPVVRIDSHLNHIHVYTTKNIYKCEKLIITAGPWLKKLCPYLPINAEAQLMGVNYYKITSNHEYFNTKNKSPAFVISDHVDPLIYSIPDIDYPGYIKAAVHMGTRINPDEPRVQPKWMQTYPNYHLNNHINYVDFSSPAKITNCMYTCTDDEYFIIDKSPINPNICIAGGFSGYGFKFGLIVGDILTKLAYDKPILYDLSFFRVDRKINNKAKL